jgi:hypothetical protein
MKLPLLLFGIGSYPGTDSSEFTALQVATLPTAGRWQVISLAWSAVNRRMEAGRHGRQTHDGSCSRSHIFPADERDCQYYFL